MSYKKTVFSNTWLSLPLYSSWLYAVNHDKYSAGCKICNSTFRLGNMGEQALTSHMKSKKHMNMNKNMKSCNITKVMFSPSSSSNVNEKTDSPSDPVPGPSTSSTVVILPLCTDIRKLFLISDDITKAEIIWCLHAAVEHMSFRSAAHALKSFKLMFPDSHIASKMQLQRTKFGYTIVYGLAPHFKRKLVDQIHKTDHIVVGFDESLNKVATKQQMDVVVRFWDSEKNEVTSRYLTSVFLGHTCADDLLRGFKTALKDLDLKKIIQISMDGPNVNFKFLSDLKKELNNSSSDPVILDLGSCGLHTLHCAFKAAFTVTQWNIVLYLRALYNLFKDVPARRADYIMHTDSHTFPKKFCAVRWAENVKVVKRAIKIHNDIKKYIAAVQNTKAKPSCKSFETVAMYIKDELLIPKLTFYEMMAGTIEPFLTEFQGEAPLAPFLYEEIRSLMESVMIRFIKENIIQAMQRSNLSITDVDITDKNNWKHPKDVDVGYAVRAALKKSKSSSEKTDSFLRVCRLSFQKFIEKMLDRSPIKYKLTKGISCLDPMVAINEETAFKRLSVCLEILVSNNWISGNEADKVDFQFKNLIKSSGMKELLQSYDRSSRLDKFWMNIIDSRHEYQELKKFCQLILIFSHGNASVERGFSINKECLLFNQTEESLIALRLVHDEVISSGGVSSIEISKQLIHSARNAHSFYTDALKNKEKQTEIEEQQQLEKKNAARKLKDLQLKKQKLLADSEKKVSLIDEEIKLLKG